MTPLAALAAFFLFAATLSVLVRFICWWTSRQADARWAAETRAQEGRGAKSKTSVHRDRGVSRGH